LGYFLLSRDSRGIWAKRQHRYALANVEKVLPYAPSCKNLFQLFGPVNQHAQLASLRIAPQLAAILVGLSATLTLRLLPACSLTGHNTSGSAAMIDFDAAR